jgi:hypothetical protein
MTQLNKGENFGRWVVLEMTSRMVDVKCECGTIKKIDYFNLIKGKSISCGCYGHPNKRRKVNIGERFGRLIIMNEIIGNYSTRKFMVKCDCGNECEVYMNNLTRGHTNSCGCFANEVLMKRNIKHGDAPRGNAATEYNTYRSMINRCSNPKDKRYDEYGGRGISVCDEWLNSYETFLNDMGRRPENKTSIDRIDVNGNYCKENCRWSDALEQARNLRSNVLIGYNGVKQCISQWNDIFKVPYGTLYFQLKRNNWDMNTVVNTYYPQYLSLNNSIL